DMNSPSWLNPLSGMGSDEARDTVLSLTEFDDSYWQNINKKLLGQLVNLLYDVHEIDPETYQYPTMLEVARILSGELHTADLTYNAALRQSSTTDADAKSTLSKGLVQGDTLPAVTKRMRGLVASTWGPETAQDRYSALARPTQDEAKSASGFGAKLMQIYN